MGFGHAQQGLGFAQPPERWGVFVGHADGQAEAFAARAQGFEGFPLAGDDGGFAEIETKRAQALDFGEYRERLLFQAVACREDLHPSLDDSVAALPVATG